MRTEHRQDGVTTYVYSQDDPERLTMHDIRNAVERVEVLCRDIMTAMSLLIDLLPEAHGNEPDADESGDPRYSASTPWPEQAKLQISELQATVTAQTAEINRLVDRIDYLDRIVHKYINGDGE